MFDGVGQGVFCYQGLPRAGRGGHQHRPFPADRFDGLFLEGVETERPDLRRVGRVGGSFGEGRNGDDPVVGDGQVRFGVRAGPGRGLPDLFGCPVAPGLPAPVGESEPDFELFGLLGLDDSFRVVELHLGSAQPVRVPRSPVGFSQQFADHGLRPPALLDRLFGEHRRPARNTVPRCGIQHPFSG